MACPYFVPSEILNDGSWPHPARLPLGAGWTGTCCAPNQQAEDKAATLAASVPVDASCVRDFCNLGYAAACPHLPTNRDWDAIRFVVTYSSPHQVTLLYICERDHAPIAHGSMTYDLPAGICPNPHPDPRVRRLAASFLHAYRVRQSNSLI